MQPNVVNGAERSLPPPHHLGFHSHFSALGGFPPLEEMSPEVIECHFLGRYLHPGRRPRGQGEGTRSCVFLLRAGNRRPANPLISIGPSCITCSLLNLHLQGVGIP